MNANRLTHAAGIVAILAALYFAVFTGYPYSGDEYTLLDASASYYRTGTLELALYHDLRGYFPAPRRLDQPVIALDVEPLQAYVAALLMAVAANVPGIGLVHAAMTLNLWLTALTGGLLYLMATGLGFRARTAALAALACGLCTMALPHARLFFREPLFTLTLCAALYALLEWRRTGGRDVWRLVLAGIAFGLALMTKGVALMAVPALITAVIPARFSRRALRIAVGIALCAAMTFILYYLIVPGVRFRYAYIWFANFNLTFLREALPAWLFSPGASIWAFSPILLAGLPGAILLWRQGNRRAAVLPVALGLPLMAGYIAFQGVGWYGGMGWGPRYLLPSIPLLCLWLLPVIESQRVRTPLVILAMISAALQLLAAYVPLSTHGDYMFNLGVGNSQRVWQEGVWLIELTPQAVALRELGRIESPIAWQLTGRAVRVLPLCGLLAGIGLLALRGKRYAAWCVPIVAPLVVGIGLIAVRDDPRFRGDDVALQALLDDLTASLLPGDAILLDDHSQRLFFLNHFRGHQRLYSLTAVAQSDPTLPPAQRVHPYLWTLLSRLGQHADRWWFVGSLAAYLPADYRPHEAFLATAYFPALELARSAENGTPRAVLFLARNAPTVNAPATALNVDFGPARLVGIDLVAGDEARSGDLLPVSLVWLAEAATADAPAFDYGVNLALVDSTGYVAVERAAQPMGTFGFMSRWQPGRRYRDNHALQLPDSLAPGTYWLRVALYDWRDGRLLPTDQGQPWALVRVVIVLP